jgi:hypothetical protein
MKQVIDAIAELVVAIRSNMNDGIVNAIRTKAHDKLLAADHHADNAQNRKRPPSWNPDAAGTPTASGCGYILLNSNLPHHGWCLRDGIGISKDLRGAADYSKQSADQGNSDGQGAYGVCLRVGIGVSQDLRGAVHYFKLSADQGNAGGQCCYGACLRDGIGILKDLRGAADYLKLSQIKGIPMVNGVMARVCSTASGLRKI